MGERCAKQLSGSFLMPEPPQKIFFGKLSSLNDPSLKYPPHENALKFSWSNEEYFPWYKRISIGKLSMVQNEDDQTEDAHLAMIKQEKYEIQVERDNALSHAAHMRQHAA